MKTRHKTRRIVATITLIAFALLALATRSSAHETHTVGAYTLRVGWHIEPTYVNQLNAVELALTQNGKPVDGAEKTLSMIVSFGGKSTDKLTLTPADAPDEMTAGAASPAGTGVYLVPLIPTRAGDYQFHFVGILGDTKIDETFDTANGKIGSVDPVNQLQFPERDPSNADLQRQIDDLKAQIAALKGTPSK